MRRYTGNVMVVLLASTAAMAAAGSGTGRFVAAFENGDYVTGDEVTGWGRPGGKARLSGRALRDEANHVRWLSDRSLSPAPRPQAFVEFVGGDRLPGAVSSASTGAPAPGPAGRPHFVVDLGAVLKNSRNVKMLRMRVARDMVRRIVWKDSRSTYPPGTLRRRDGRTVRFSGIRFRRHSAVLLVDRGTVEVRYEEMAELRLPRPKPWDAYFDELAALSGDLADRLFQLETTTGLIATASARRLRPMPYSDSRDPDFWYHLIHPAWSLDAFAVRCGEVRIRRYFRAHQVPLTRTSPVWMENRSIVFPAWPCRVNHSVQGRPLASGGRLYGWGFGVHGASRLEFAVPPMATAFRTRIGLDSRAGAGGCVRTTVLLDRSAPKAATRPKGRPMTLHTSDILIGSGKTADTGRLRLPPNRTPGHCRLVLAVDPMNLDYPSGADPLDIRDTLDWLEPTVELDRAALAAEVRRRIVGCLPAWSGWSLDKDQAAEIQLLGHWDAMAGQGANYRYAAGPGKTPLVLRRTVAIGTGDAQLVIVAARPGNMSAPAILQVHVDGKQVAGGELPVRYTGQDEPAPLTVPLGKWSGKRVRLAIVLGPKDPKGGKLAVDWRSITIAAGDPAGAPTDEQ